MVSAAGQDKDQGNKEILPAVVQYLEEQGLTASAKALKVSRSEDTINTKKQ